MKEVVPARKYIGKILKMGKYNDNELFDMAKAKWEDLQIVLAIEEMSELTKVLCKYQRMGIVDDRLFNSLSDELADVEIMIDQLKRFFKCSDTVRECRKIKLDRLEKRLE